MKVSAVNLISRLFLLTAGAMLTGCKETPDLTQKEVEERIQKELPRGSSIKQVQAFIDSYRSNFFITDAGCDQMSFNSPANNFAVAEDKSLRSPECISVWIHRTRSSAKVSATWNIRMTFYFNQNGTLSRHPVSTFGTH